MITTAEKPLTANGIRQDLMARFPQEKIFALRHPVLPGHWIVKISEPVAQELWIVPGQDGDEIRPASHMRSAELLSRLLNHPVWVSGWPHWTRTGISPRRLTITLRDEGCYGSAG